MKKLLQMIKRKAAAEDGQSIVEFALTLPLLLLLLCGILDFGWIYVNQYKTDYAAFSGSRYAAIYAGSTNDMNELTAETDSRVRENLLVNSANAEVTLSVTASEATVTVTCPIPNLTFVASTLFGKYYSASSTSVSTR